MLVLKTNFAVNHVFLEYSEYILHCVVTHIPTNKYDFRSKTHFSVKIIVFSFLMEEARGEIYREFFFALRSKKGADQIKWLMAKGGDYFVNSPLPDTNLDTPLISCVKMQGGGSSLEIVKALVECGAEVDFQDENGRTEKIKKCFQKSRRENFFETVFLCFFSWR